MSMRMWNAGGSTVRKSVADFLDDERGATAIEYSLIAGLIFLAIVGAVRAYVDSTSEMYSDISDKLD